MPRGKHVRISAPLSAPKSNRIGESMPKSNESKRNGMGTHVLLPPARSTCQGTNTSAHQPHRARPNPTAEGKACPCHTKRIETGWELTYCSPPTVQHAKGQHVRILAPLSAPQSNRRGESVPKSNQTKRNWLGTHVLLPRDRSTCQGNPRQHFGPAERAQI